LSSEERTGSSQEAMTAQNALPFLFDHCNLQIAGHRCRGLSRKVYVKESK